MRIRRYYGHDCNSFEGFNNGYYIDADPIDVSDDAEAMRMCKAYLDERWITDAADREELDDGYQYTTGYFDDDGNELTRDTWIEANESREFGSYRYVYVTYEVCNDAA